VFDTVPLEQFIVPYHSSMLAEAYEITKSYSLRTAGVPAPGGNEFFSPMMRHLPVRLTLSKPQAMAVDD